MMSFRKVISVVFICFMASHPLLAKEMRIAIGVPESHFEYAAIQKFEVHVENNSDINVTVYASNQLGSDQEALEQMRFNVVQMNLPSPAVLGNFVKDFNILTLPFIFPNEEIANQVVDGEWGQTLSAKLEPADLVGLGYGNFGFRHVSNNIRKITSVEDFSGLKLRTMQNKAHLDAFRALGANPTPMAFSELFSSLQQGVVDGQENPYTNIYSQRLYEVQKYLSDSGHVYSWVVFVVSKRFFDDLSHEEQSILHQAARIAIDYMRKTVREEDKNSLQSMINAGLDYTPLSSQVKKEMHEKVAPVIQAYADKINPELYKQLSNNVTELQ